MDRLDELLTWMRANGVLECSHEGTTIRLASVDLPSPPGSATDEGPSPDPRPLTSGGCRICGKPTGQGIFADRGLCRRCGYLEQMGASGN